MYVDRQNGNCLRSKGGMMAERRMFTKKITDDDHFLSLSSSAQALYLHLSMSCDDDGFSNQVNASMFKAHASIQDLQALLENRYIYQFENGVIVIKHWRMANALRKDRYTPTAFQEELKMLHLKDNGVYTLDGFKNGCRLVATGKDSIEKISIDQNKDIIDEPDEFEPLWKLYPRKQGKDKAYKAFQKARKEGVEVSTIKTGILNYLNYIEGSKIEPKYIKMGATWFNNRCWNDDYTIQPQQRKGSYFQPSQATYIDFETYEANAVAIDEDDEELNFGGNAKC